MDAESFNSLALRVISREATDDERRALETELSSVPSRRDEFEQLKLTHEILRATAPMTEAARATSPELPAYRVNELRTAVRQYFGPAANRKKNPARVGAWIPALRGFFIGSGVAALGFAVVIFCFANRTAESLFNCSVRARCRLSMTSRELDAKVWPAAAFAIISSGLVAVR